MMKRFSAIVLLIVIGLIAQPISYAMVSDWAKEQARKLGEKIGVAQQNIIALQKTLKQHAACLSGKGCLPGQKERIKALALAAGIGLGALLAIAVSAGIAVKAGIFEKEKEMPFVPGVAGINVADIAAGIGITIPTDASTPSLFIRAVLNGVTNQVKKWVDLVEEKVLKVGQEIARQKQVLTADQTQQKMYKNIENIIKKTLITYNESKLQQNLRFIYAATTGLLGEVMALMCNPFLKPSKNAQDEAIAQVTPKTKISSTFKDIVDFIKNPQCSRGQ